MVLILLYTFQKEKVKAKYTHSLKLTSYIEWI